MLYFVLFVEKLRVILFIKYFCTLREKQLGNGHELKISRLSSIESKKIKKKHTCGRHDVTDMISFIKIPTLRNQPDVIDYILAKSIVCCLFALPF